MTNFDKFTIFGERCSGTNYLEHVMTTNFDIKYSSDMCNKHFFCFNDYNKVDASKMLFIGIVRNPIYWLNSFSKELYHVPEINRQSLNNFLFNEWYSVLDEQSDNKPTNHFNENTSLSNKRLIRSYPINKKDLNYNTGKKCKNIFELRKIKNKYLMEKMPQMFPNNYILINYESLLYKFEETMHEIQRRFNLKLRYSQFVNTKKYKKSDKYSFVNQRTITFDPPTVDLIWKHLCVEQETSLGYFKNDNNGYFKNSQPDQRLDNIPFKLGIAEQQSGQ